MRVHRFESDQGWPVGARQMRAVAQRTTPKALGFAGHASGTQIVQRGAAIHFGAHHMAFFNPQRAQRLQPVGPHLPRFSAGQHMLPDPQAVVRGRENLECQLARKGQTQNPQLHACQRAAAPGVQKPHKGQGGVAQVQVRKCRLQRFTCPWAGHAHGSPLVGHRCHRDTQFRPHDLQQKLQMAHHLGRLRRGGGHEKLGVADARGGAVVQHDGVLAQHEAVACFAHRQLGKSVDVDAVQKLRGVGPLHIDLAQRRGVGNAHAVAHKIHFDLVGLGQVGAVGPVPQGPQPQAGFKPHAAVRPMPVVHGGAALGLEVFAHIAPGQHAQSHRRIGRTEGGGTGLRHIQGPGLCHQAQAVDVGGLALVGSHSQRGVALQMLDRHIALALRQFHVGSRHIVLEVNKGLVARARAEQRRGGRKSHGVRQRCLPCGQCRRRGLQTDGLCSLLTRMGTAGNRRFPALRTHHAARAEHGRCR